MAGDPDEWAMRGEPDPAAVMLTHLLLLMLGVAMGAIGGVSFTLWWLSRGRALELACGSIFGAVAVFGFFWSLTIIAWAMGWSEHHA